MRRKLDHCILLVIFLGAHTVVSSLALANEDKMKNIKMMMKKENMTVTHLSRENPDAASMAMSLTSLLHEKSKNVLVFLDV